MLKADNVLSDKRKRKEQKNKSPQFPRWSPICILWLALTLWGSQYCKRKQKQAKTRLSIWKWNGKVKTLLYSFETVVGGSCATSSELIRKVHWGLYRQTVADRCWKTRDCNILQSSWLNERKMTLKCLLSWRLLGNGNLNPLAFGRLRWKDETRVMILCD